MADRSEDEWSLVSEGEEILSDMSFDEAESEPETQAKADQQAAVLNPAVSLACDDTIVVPSLGEDLTDVLSLLADTNVLEHSTAEYSREVRVSLLAPAHQYQLIGASPRYSSFPSTRKRNVKLAFNVAGSRSKSFPERLRAITNPLYEKAATPTFTEVTSFTHDQSTQTDFNDTAAKSHEARATLLLAALQRSMTMAMQIRSKSQDNERLSLRIVELESAAIERSNASHNESQGE